MESQATNPVSVSAVCVKVSFLLGHIDEVLSNDQIEDKFFKGSKFKNFINELIKEAQNGQTTALALDLCALRDGLRNLQKPELQKQIEDAIWHCERAIDALYEFQGINPNITNPFFRADSSDDD